MSLTSPQIEDNAALNNAILERGVFYYPAGRHYGNPDASVNCDRCRRTGITACIGFDRFDYCLPCVDAIVRTRPTGPGTWNPDIEIPRPIRDPLESPRVTLMLQNMFTTAMSQGMFTTRMEHNMYRPSRGTG
jgi:hypothetical protein